MSIQPRARSFNASEVALYWKYSDGSSMRPEVFSNGEPNNDASHALNEDCLIPTAGRAAAVYDYPCQLVSSDWHCLACQVNASNHGQCCFTSYTI